MKEFESGWKSGKKNFKPKMEGSFQRTMEICRKKRGKFEEV